MHKPKQVRRREELAAENGAPSPEYSDDSWSGVTYSVQFQNWKFAVLRHRGSRAPVVVARFDREQEADRMVAELMGGRR